MAITVKHKFVSAIPDAGDTTIVQPSNWNDDHQLVGTVPVANGGTGASTLTGYVKGTGTTAMTAATTIPNTDITGLGTASTKDAGVANGVATLDSSGTVPLSQIPALGDLNYQGTWNATTNSPTLTSSVGTKGFYYVVSVAGTTNLNGITDWQIGDWAVFNGSVWQKIDNTDAVTSVNGYTGTVVLTAADVSAVPYTGATGAVDLNNKSLTNVSNLGVGTAVVPTIKIRAVGDNNSSSRIAMRGYSSDANSSAIRVTKFRGTTSAPQAPQSGDSLGKFELAGYGTTSSEGYPQASLEGVATEAWGAIARGTKAVIKVTPNTTTTQVTALTINQDSTAVFANTVTANGTLLTGNTGTVTSVAATAGTGISVSGSPITTSGTLTITNTAPDQTVAFTNGTGISVTGTYPNFTVTNTAPSSGGTVTSVATSGTVNGLTLTGGPITNTGTVTLGGTLDLSSPPTIGNTAPNTGKFTTLEATGTSSLGTTSAQYIQAVGNATEPQILAVGSGTNIPLVLQPKGTGALQAQATTSSTVGGNARGANAVDWQMARLAAARVASSQYSVIGGGNNNSATGYNATTAGGESNQATGSYTFLGGGSGNQASGSLATIVGGGTNTSAGYFNFIGGGQTNSGTALAAVTTQATTTVTSGSTAVTLSGSNANIKVGQLIAGTGMVSYTYVAAISGTALTLSQNASATGTPTLSFFTPHGVVVGGGNNQATGSYSFIGGGGDAGTAANRNVASGDWSFVGGGLKGTASNAGSVVVGGGIFTGVAFPNTASGVSAGIVAGLSNVCSGQGAFIGAGYGNLSNGTYSAVFGSIGTARGISGNTVVSTQAINTVVGNCQSALLILAKQTTDATATVLTSDGNAAGTVNQVILPNNSAYYFKVRVISGVTGAGNTKAWTLEGAIKRGANAASTAIVGTVTTTIVAADVGAATWTVTATADTTNGGLAITVTGQASTTIRWVAKAETAEMTF